MSIDYHSFHALYKQSDLLPNIIKNYNKYEIVFDQGQDAPATAGKGDTVSKMAKRATDLSDLN